MRADTKPWLRRACVIGAVLVSMTLLAACGGSSGVTVSCQGVRPATYAQVILVGHQNSERVDELTLFVVCRSDGAVRIFDKNGGSYSDIDDFRAHNTLLTDRDTIEVPRRIPPVGKNVGWVELSGHTTDRAPIVLALAGSAALLVIAGFILWWIRRRWGAPTAGSPPTTSA